MSWYLVAILALASLGATAPLGNNETDAGNFPNFTAIHAESSDEFIKEVSGEKLCETAKADLMLIIDTSSSMEDVFEKERQVAIDLIESLPSGPEGSLRIAVAMVRFSGSATLELGLDKGNTKTGVMEVIRNLQFSGGGSQTAAAVTLATKELKRAGRPDANKIVVLLTDGKSEDSWSLVLKTSETLHSVQPQVFVLSLSPSIAQRELEQYAGNPDRVYLENRRPEFKSDILRMVTELDCKPIKTFEALPVLQTTEELEPVIEECKISPVDLMIILDTSSSVEEVFLKERQLAIDLVKSVPVSEFSTRVSVATVRFSSTAHLEIPFDSPQNKEQIIKELENIKHTGGGTSAATAVRLAVTQILKGTRRDARSIVVLISDGNSQDPMSEVKDTAFELENTGAEVYAVTMSEEYYMPELVIYAGHAERVYTGESVTTFFTDLDEVTNRIECRQPEPELEDNPCTKTDLMIILDTSGSVRQDFEKERELAIDMIRALPNVVSGNTRVAVAAVTFANTPHLAIEFGEVQTKQDAIKIIRSIRHTGGGTGTAAAVQLAVNELARNRRRDAEQLVVLINDGYSRDPWQVVQDTSERLRNSAENVYAVTFNHQPYLPELKHYSTSDEHVFVGRQVDFFMDEFKQVIAGSEDGVCVDKEPKNSNEAVVKPDPDANRECDPVDIMIILDSSGSVAHDFERERQLALDVVQKLPVAGGNTAIKVGLVRFASYSETVIELGENLDKTALIERILDIEHTGGATYTAAAVRKAIEEIKFGRRGGVRTVVILINDGNSADDWPVVSIASDQLQKTADEVYAVTFSRQAYMPELTLYAGSPERVYEGDAGVTRFFKDMGQFTNPNMCNGDGEPEYVTDAPETPKPQPQTLKPEPETPRPQPETPTPQPDTPRPQPETPRPQPDTPRPQPDTPRPQPVTDVPIPADCHVASIDLMLILDTSGSVEDVFIKQKELAIETVKSLPIGSRIAVAIVKFSDASSLELQFADGASTEDALATLEKTQYTGGNTATANAVRTAIREITTGRRSDAKQVVVLMNDGNSQDPWQTVLDTSEQLQQTGAEIFAVSYSDEVFTKELSVYAGGRNRVYIKEDMDRFRRDLQKVTSEVICPTEDKTTAATCGFSKMDLFIILDASGSVKSKFEHYREIALSLIERLPIAAGQTHVGVGLVSFSHDAYLQIPLDHGQSKEQVRSTIEGVQFKGGSTHTAQAVNLAVEDLRRGRRSDALQVVVLMNDGNSQDPWPKVFVASQDLEQTARERFVVALGDQIYMPELVHYSGNPGRVYRDEKTSQFLDDVVNLLGDGSGCPTPTIPPVTSPADCGPEKIDFILVTDSTGPSSDIFESNRNIMLDILGGFPFDLDLFKFAVVNFGEDWAEVVLKLTDDQSRDNVLNTLIDLQYVGGETNSEKAVMAAIGEWERARRPDTRPVFVVLMNNQESADQPNVILDAGTKLRNTGGQTYGCQLQSNNQRQDLLSYTSNQAEYVYLQNDISNFVTEMRSLYSSTECKTSEAPVTTRATTQPTPKPTTKFTTPETYIDENRQKDLPDADIEKPKPKPTTTTEATTTTTTKAATTQPKTQPPTTFRPGCVFDILYILDASGSVEDVFNRAKQSAVETVEHLRLGPNNARVAMIKFAGPNKAYTVFSFDTYTKNQDIIAAIESATHISGTTDTTNALEHALTEYHKNRGARPGVATPMAFVFTDGYAMSDTTKAAEELRKKIPDVFAIGTGKPVNKGELENITGDAGGVYTDENYGDFLALLDRVVESCQVLL